ncbi:MAG: hypothetical protein LBJ31_09210 [Treponema sp.]|jgi:hypothetical protein|nr:hypothetical protein [Treponema sp.]
MKRFAAAFVFLLVCFAAAAQPVVSYTVLRSAGTRITLHANAALPERWLLNVHYLFQGSMDQLGSRSLELVFPSSATEEFDFFPKNGRRFIAFNSERRDLPLEIRIGEGEGDFTVTGVEFKARPAASAILEPISADLGTILYYPRSRWRQKDYEVFRFNHDSRILYLVSASHAVQSEFLRRLAFFVEKRGFAGRLSPDEEIKNLRDWGAHDYRGADLARFFQKAESENFPLNAGELFLRDLLLENGIIHRTRAGITAGEGALIGFSAEITDDRLPAYFVHETIHGLYFTRSALRDAFKKTFDAYSETEKYFLRIAFDYREYNVMQDDDLLINETAAYLLQQRPRETPEYFLDIIGYWFRMASPPRMAETEAWVKNNSAVFARRSEELQRQLFAVTGLRVENFFDLLPKNRRLPMIP